MTVTLPKSTAVVTVSYNSSSALEDFLASIASASSDSLLVVVADNASWDAAEARRISERHGAQFVELGSNLGYGGAINAAVRKLPGTITAVVVSNPDVLFDPGSIDELVSALDQNPRAAAAGPLVRNEDGSVYPSARALPSLRNGIGHAMFAGIWPSNPWSSRYHRDNDFLGADRRVGWLSGSCFIARRTAFDAVGGFDESYFMYFEDVDLGYRLGKAGWTNIYHPAAHVTHTGAHSTKDDPAPMISAHHRSAIRYLNRRYSAPILAPLRLALSVGLVARERLLVRRLKRENDRSTEPH